MNLNNRHCGGHAMRKEALHHYDEAATKTTTHTQARSSLQRFHNNAKRALLYSFAQGAPRLLDLACGRGGDINKWIACDVGLVTGLDLSKKSVQEAQRRFQATGATRDYRFSQFDLVNTWQGSAPFDVVTCMFALHYFFSSKQDTHRLLSTVARNLKPGGYFIGIVPDGRRVNECIKDGPVFDNGVMRVEARWQGMPQCFGSPYTCGIKGTVTQDSQVPEYLVYGSVLTAVAEQHGLRPVPIAHPSFQPEGPLHHLKPPYQGPMAECSRMYAGFAFKKCDQQN